MQASSVSSFWDGGWLVQLGLYMNGYKAEQTLMTTNSRTQQIGDRGGQEGFPRQ
jgi:hypothetical protein